MWLKKKGTIECDNSTIIYNVGIFQCYIHWNHPIWQEKKREPPNVTIVRSHEMLLLPNVKLELSDVSKKKMEPSHVTKVRSYVMLVPPNVMLESSNMWLKNNDTIICHIGTTQCDIWIIWTEKNIKDSLNVTQVHSYVILVLLNVIMEPFNVTRK